MSSRQGWRPSGVEVPVPPIACIQTVCVSGACGGNDARLAGRKSSGCLVGAADTDEETGTRSLRDEHLYYC
jgi:hypothetical protein